MLRSLVRRSRPYASESMVQSRVCALLSKNGGPGEASEADLNPEKPRKPRSTAGFEAEQSKTPWRYDGEA